MALVGAQALAIVGVPGANLLVLGAREEQVALGVVPEEALLLATYRHGLLFIAQHDGVGVWVWR